MNSRMKALLSLVGALFAVFGLRSKYREARKNNDRLAMADLVLSTLGTMTGTALAVRELRKGEDPE